MEAKWPWSDNKVLFINYNLLGNTITITNIHIYIHLFHIYEIKFTNVQYIVIINYVFRIYILIL